jgi:hypothetical protein
MAGSGRATPAMTPHPPDDVLRQPTLLHSRERSTIVFCGDAEQVGAGFALALAVMKAHENLLIMSLESNPKGD